MPYLTTKNSYLILNGQQIAYRELGTGKSDLPLVMLVHLAANLDNWDPKLIDLLAQDQHLVLLNLPGVGASQGKVATSIPGMAEQAIAIIQALGYDRINLLGLSMGGMVAQEIVRHQSQLVEKLILVGTGERGGIGIDKVTQKTFRYMLKTGLTKTDPKRYIFYNHDTDGKRVADQVLARLASRDQAFADKPVAITSFLRQLLAINRWGKAPSDDLSFISQPTLIVNGDQDMMVPTENSRTMHQKLGQSQLIIYPQSGHGSLFQYAEQFAQDALTFLKNN